MRKNFVVISALMLVLTACSLSEAKTLAVYFSRTGSTQSMTEIITEHLSRTVSVDVFRLEAADPYPENYDAVLERAQSEQNTGARPTLARDAGDISEYDTVLLGYPIWYGTIPMIVATFLEAHDFAEKRVIPYNTHGGSGVGRSITDIRNILAGVTVEDGFAVSGSRVSSSGAEITSWVDGLNITQTLPVQTEQSSPDVSPVAEPQDSPDVSPNVPTLITPRNSSPDISEDSNSKSGSGCESGLPAIAVVVLLGAFRKK